MKRNSANFIGWFLSNPYVSGFIIFCVVFLVSIFISVQEYKLFKETEQKQQAATLELIEKNIEQSLRSSYVSTFTLALTISDDGQPKEFKAVADKLIESNNLIDGVQLVPDGVIKYVYPFEKHKEALNLDVLNHPETREEALKAIKRREIYFAGPLKLKQGGIGIVGRLPVFIKNEFWGFSGVVIKLEHLIEKLGIRKFNEEFYFQFSKVNPISGKEEFFLETNPQIDLAEADKMLIEEGDWNIYISSKENNDALKSTFPFLILGLLLSSVCAIITIVIFKRPAELQKLVKIQTEKLLDSELKFKTIFEQAGVGIVHLNASDGKFIEANKRFCDKVLLSSSTLKDKSFYDLLEEPSSKTNLFQKSKIELKLRRDDGMPMYVRLTNAPYENEQGLTYISIVEDITEKKKAQENLRELKTRMEMAIRVSKLAYWEWDVNTDDITWSNRMYEIFEVPYDTKLSSSVILSYVHPKDLEKYKRNTKKILNGDTLQPYEVRIITEKGNTIHILAHVENEINKDGKTTKLKGSLLDVSKEKRAEKELSHSYKLVLEQNKRLLNFSYIISHNLRSHSSNIQSLLSLLLSTNIDAEQEEMLTMLNSVSRSLDETLYDLNDIVDIQKNTTITKESLSVKKYLDRVLRTLSAQILAKEAEVRWNNIAEDEKIKFNAAYFESILLNFISNAIRYSHPNRKPVIEITFREEADYKILTIKDNGIGIDLSLHGDKIFGMYKTFTSHPDSRGIGLFLSKNQLEVLGGFVEVESQPEFGSTFTLYFKK